MRRLLLALAVLVATTASASAQRTLLPERPTCLQVHNAPVSEGPNWGDLKAGGVCPMVNASGQCVDRQHRTEVRNSCDRDVHVIVEIGNEQSRTTLAPGKTDRFSCNEHYDKCRGIIVSGVLNDMRGDTAQDSPQDGQIAASRSSEPDKGYRAPAPAMSIQAIAQHCSSIKNYCEKKYAGKKIYYAKGKYFFMPANVCESKEAECANKNGKMSTVEIDAFYNKAYMQEMRADLIARDRAAPPSKGSAGSGSTGGGGCLPRPSVRYDRCLAAGGGGQKCQAEYDQISARFAAQCQAAWIAERRREKGW